MSYWVLFLIITFVIMVAGAICAFFIEKYRGDGIGITLLLPITVLTAIFFFVGVPLGYLLGNIKEYSGNEYDLEAIYSEYESESTPGCICIKNTKEVDYYYSYARGDGVYINGSCTDKIVVEELVGGKRRIKYTTYVPSEKALSQKTEWGKIETFRLQKDTESKPAEKAENSRDGEQE